MHRCVFCVPNLQPHTSGCQVELNCISVQMRLCMLRHPSMLPAHAVAHEMLVTCDDTMSTFHATHLCHAHCKKEVSATVAAVTAVTAGSQHFWGYYKPASRTCCLV
jgi:hypothetical protein